MGHAYNINIMYMYHGIQTVSIVHIILHIHNTVYNTKQTFSELPKRIEQLLKITMKELLQFNISFRQSQSGYCY